MTGLKKHLKNPEIHRVLRFALVGAWGTLIDIALLALLKSAGLVTILANTLSFCAGLANNYYWNRRWTFEIRESAGWKRQFIQFGLVSLAGLALNNAIVLLLEAPFGVLLGAASWGYLPAKVVATGVVMFWNYFANRQWTFRQDYPSGFSNKMNTAEHTFGSLSQSPVLAGTLVEPFHPKETK